MTAVRHRAPAFYRRAFFFGILAGAAGLAPAAMAQKGYRPPPGYLQLGKPDQAEGRRILEEFRVGGAMGISGEYYLEFELRVLPRRGEERSYQGRLWGSSNAQGPISRVSLDANGAPQRLLVQNGPQAAVWTAGGTGKEPVTMLGVAALFTPLASTNFTPFDLQMPFLYWTDFVYEGIAKVRGRPAYQFLLYPPADFAAKYPALTGVRLYLDTEYRQPVQSEQIGDGGRLLKSMILQELKKISGQWLPKTIDLRDETTRDKTRLSVTGAALGQSFAGGLFTPSALADEARPPAAGSVVRIEP
ncbi:MAG TPA: outer membrane lipoprotein-sorting protein [Opitutaceae bacterium]|nr:outer membrane lipoprotein-sorting protein [Opitutaceae bacterium]